MSRGQRAPSAPGEAAWPRGECELHQSRSGVMSLSMPGVPRQGTRSLLLLLISHPFCCRERTGGLFSVGVPFTWKSSSVLGHPQPSKEPAQVRCCIPEETILALDEAEVWTVGRTDLENASGSGVMRSPE